MSQHDDSPETIVYFCNAFADKIEEQRRHLDGRAIANEWLLAIELTARAVAEVFKEELGDQLSSHPENPGGTD